MKKIIGRFSSLAIVLAMMAPVVSIANAQDSNATLPQVRTPEQIKELNERIQMKAHIRVLQKNAQDLNRDVNKQGGKIDDLTMRTEKLESDSATTSGTVKSLNGAVTDLKKSDGANQAAISTMEKSMFALAGFVLVCSFAIFLFVKNRRSAKTVSQNLEDLKDEVAAKVTVDLSRRIESMVYEVGTQRIKEVVRLERPLPNPNEPKLRSEWKRLREETPIGPLFIAAEKVFEKRFGKEDDVEGPVEYSIDFDDDNGAKSVDGLTPRWFYQGVRIPNKGVVDHALAILRTKQSALLQPMPDNLRFIKESVENRVTQETTPQRIAK